jgi:hypothetical protein
VDVPRRGERALAVRQQGGERRLVGDQDPDVLGMAGDERKGIDRPAATGEEIDRPAADRLDHLVDVAGVLVGRGLARGIGLRAAVDAARVVGHDRSDPRSGGPGCRSPPRPSASR